MPQRGKLIVVEGLDRAGKSTQVERLCANLLKDGQRVERMGFPDRSTPIGKSIDAYLKGEAQIQDHVIHLLFSANRWEAAKGIKAKLQAGITLVIDRYSFSGAVYSAAKQNPNLGLEWAWSPEVGLPAPDIVLYLTVTPAVAATRGGFGTEKYENRQMQQRVRGRFTELWSRGVANVLSVDADKDLDTVEAEVLNGARKMFSSFPTDIPLRYLEPIRDKFAQVDSQSKT